MILSLHLIPWDYYYVMKEVLPVSMDYIRREGVTNEVKYVRSQ